LHADLARLSVVGEQAFYLFHTAARAMKHALLTFLRQLFFLDISAPLANEKLNHRTPSPSILIDQWLVGR
jgi:hypothetical protein